MEGWVVLVVGLKVVGVGGLVVRVVLWACAQAPLAVRRDRGQMHVHHLQP